MQAPLRNFKHFNHGQREVPVGMFPASSESPSCLRILQAPVGNLGQFLFIENKYTSCLQQLW